MRWTTVNGPNLNAAEDLVGGKAANLLRIGTANLVVPKWFCVNTNVFNSILTRLGSEFSALLESAKTANPNDLEAISATLVSQFTRIGLSDGQANALLETFDRLFDPGTRVAVRSSAVCEDSVHSSYAGLLETYLNVNRSQVLKRIIDCLASCFSPQCLMYRNLNGGDVGGVSTAVIVQQMIQSTSSGVLFTANPIRSEDGKMVVTACFGLGEGAVQDQAETDTYLLDYRSGKLLNEQIALKTKQVISSGNDSDGTYVVDVPAVRRMEKVLSADQLLKLHVAGMTLQEKLGKPQDIEWAFDPVGNLFVLQTRPITTIRHHSRISVFDCSNISENYHGATTAMTYSYVRKYYEDIFVAAARRFGIQEKALAENHVVFSNLVAFLNGGLYYNLPNWYRMFYVVPGFNYFVKSFEHGVGLNGTPAELQEEVQKYSEKTIPLLRRLGTWVRIVRNFALLPGMIRRHEGRFVEFRKEFEHVPLEKLGLHELAELFTRIQTVLAARWEAPLINDYYAFNFFFLLDRLLRRWGIDQSDELLSDLLRGNEELASVEPIRAMTALAHLAQGSANVRATVEQGGQRHSKKSKMTLLFPTFI